MANRQARGGNLRSLTLLIELGALIAERLAAGSFADVLALDIVTRIAVGIIVVHRLLNRVPW